ncbi:MAG: NPCBM/NEW2 domain-containing protein [Clostridiales bacterium]|nr:NPCBM/NEW2 domain-containing protein [Clostridiales bacterium]
MKRKKLKTLSSVLAFSLLLPSFVSYAQAEEIKRFEGTQGEGMFQIENIDGDQNFEVETFGVEENTTINLLENVSVTNSEGVELTVSVKSVMNMDDETFQYDNSGMLNVGDVGSVYEVTYMISSPTDDSETYDVTKRIISIPANVEEEIPGTEEESATETFEEKVLPISESQQLNNEKIKYLSDEKEASVRVGYGRFGKDQNTEMKENGNGLQVQINGEKVTFPKGIFAHATSTVIYDVSKYKDTYTNFVGYLGVDTRTGGGNGVKFTISVSDNKDDEKSWQTIYQSGVVGLESVYVNLDMQGKKYIKLYAEDNGSATKDHVVYANAGFATKDYNPLDSYSAPIKPLAEYDQELSKINYNDVGQVKENINKIYQRELVNRAGFYTINEVYKMEEGKYKDAMNYLINNEDNSLYYYINGGPKPAQGNYKNSLIAFGKLYNAHKDDFKDQTDDKFNLRLAISVASVYANPNGVKFWQTSSKPYSEDPVRRYNTYKELSKDNGPMDEAANLAENRNMSNAKWSAKQFRELSVPMMRWVVDSRMHEDEFTWLYKYVLDWAKQDSNKNKNFLDSYMFVHNKKYPWEYENEKYYNEENKAKWEEKYKLEELGNFDDDAKYGTKGLVRSWTVWEEGGVCGSYAKTYTNLAEVFGRPSTTCGQPAHAAAITWQWNKNGGADHKGQYEWQIQNNAWSWRETSSEFDDYMLGWGNRRKLGNIDTNRNRASSYIMLTTDVLEGDWDKYVEAKLYTLLANSYKNTDDKEKVLRLALDKQPKFLDAWYGLLDIRLNNENLSSEEAFKFSQEIISGFKYYPMVMDDLLREITLSGKITETNHLGGFYIERQSALEEAYALRKNEKDLTAEDYAKTRQPWVAGDVARAILEKDHSRIASFSFDGDNAGSIVVTEKLKDKDIEVRYSVDGGQTWKESRDHIIKLSDEDLNAITAENDILVSLKDLTSVYKIDILTQEKPKNIYLNDNENVLLGNVKNLQYKKNENDEWQNYPQDGVNNEVRFDGDTTVSVRFAPNGVYLASEIESFTFTEDIHPENAKYLPLQYVTLDKFSSEQNNGDQAAKNLIDGNYNTKWHSKWNVKDDKFISVKFDKARHISKLEYVPSKGGMNGQWKTIDVYGSNDGTNWTRILENKELSSDKNPKEIELNSQDAYQYIKIQGLESYGNSGNEKDMYFCGSELNFYEDTTKQLSE